MGKAEIKPTKATGTYVSPESWNNVISDPETVVIDVRNYYEHSVGTFTNSIQPNTKSFREFPEWVDQELKPMMKKKTKKIAMFCTGGIRCEKASSYLLQEGFKEVLQLQGGIQKYLQEVRPEESFWQGECFVFDDRVSLQHGLIEGARIAITCTQKKEKNALQKGKNKLSWQNREKKPGWLFSLTFFH